MRELIEELKVVTKGLPADHGGAERLLERLSQHHHGHELRSLLVLLGARSAVGMQAPPAGRDEAGVRQPSVASQDRPVSTASAAWCWSR